MQPLGRKSGQRVILLYVYNKFPYSRRSDGMLFYKAVPLVKLGGSIAYKRARRMEVDCLSTRNEIYNAVN